MIEVDTGQPLIHDINKTDADQVAAVAILKLASELVLATDERFVVILERCWVVRPFSTSGHVTMVSVEQSDMFVGDAGAGDSNLDVTVSVQNTTLAPGRAKLTKQNPERATFPTCRAPRTEYVIPETSPAAFDQSFE